MRKTTNPYRKRPCIKTRQLSGTSIQDAQGTYRDDAGYYQVYNHDNGFAGCVDWTQPLFPRNLSIGMGGYDVYLFTSFSVSLGCPSDQTTSAHGQDKVDRNATALLIIISS